MSGNGEDITRTHGDRRISTHTSSGPRHTTGTSAIPAVFMRLFSLNQADYQYLQAHSSRLWLYQDKTLSNKAHWRM